jgi:hypothetical protein
MGSSALAAKLNKPLDSAASLDIDLEEEQFGAEPVDAVNVVEEDVRATAPVDDLEAAEIETTAHSVQRDTDALSSPRRPRRLLFSSSTNFASRLSRLLLCACLRLGSVLLYPASSNMTS